MSFLLNVGPDYAKALQKSKLREVEVGPDQAV